MAFKMKGSAYKLGNVATKSALKHTGVGKHYHGPMWLPNRILKSGSAGGTNPFEEREKAKRNIMLEEPNLTEDELKQRMAEWTGTWKEEHGYESMPSRRQMMEIPWNPDRPLVSSDGTIKQDVLTKFGQVDVSAEDKNPRVLMGFDKGEGVRGGVLTTDVYGVPTQSVEDLEVFGTNKDLLEKSENLK